MMRHIKESRGIRAAAFGLLLLAPLAACDVDGLLEVPAPDKVLAGDLEDPSNAELLVNSAIANFECALAFYIVGGGYIGEEIVDAQLAAATWPMDRRDGEPTGLYGTNTCDDTGNVGIAMYRPVQTARYTADQVLTRLQEWTDAEVPDRQALIAGAAAYSGYSHILLGEGFCSAAIDGGPEVTSQQVFELAEQRFETAIAAAQSAGDNSLLNMARVGLARTLVNQGDYAEAGQVAAQVPQSFERLAFYTPASDRSGNQVFRWINRFNRASVDARYYGDMQVQGVDDPRVELVNSGEQAADAFTIVIDQTKYPTEDSEIPLATWEEAQLIEAEAAYRAGDLAGANAAITELRAQYGLPASNAATLEEFRSVLIYERRAELFLEGQHLYDLIRFDQPLRPAAGTEYPIKGGIYGDALCLPLPDVERQNNPNI